MESTEINQKSKQNWMVLKTLIKKISGEKVHKNSYEDKKYIYFRVGNSQLQEIYRPYLSGLGGFEFITEAKFIVSNALLDREVA